MSAGTPTPYVSSNYSPAARNNAQDRRRLVTLTVLAVAVVAAFTLLAYVLPVPRLVRLTTRLCETADCRHYAALLTRGLNRSIDPCHDFEAYVCSTWTPDTRYPALSNALDDLAMAWMDGLDDLLDRGARTIPAARKPRALLSWPEEPTAGDNVNVASVLVNLALHWDVSLWLCVRVTRHPFVPGARRIVFLPGRKSDVRLFAAKHALVMATGSYER
ncbi:hypothetical protein HPB52_016147 [Rhipicephalus sanguineus]|uniref:Peptidase M13 N-terminal domain-containing protein n=1 Tax=Rhipicephalus sanguineus TaxID=34632 RepID=A0A9D4SUN2_RHISA|nr:hypothetical protein HPB52_016147 [Rhipicephalus sanguineus]